MQCRALISSELDPYWNLAVEERLLEGIQRDSEPILFFWQSQPAVIIGKNQNPWRECNLDWMHAHGVALGRRISGGGAVYHDLGNLNYALFLPRETYEANAVFDRTVTALRHLGIQAHRSDRTSLFVDEYKISGHAFCMRKHAVLHHGTLLFGADIESLRRALKPCELWRIETKATASVRARVENLSRWRAGVKAEDIQDALMWAWQCSGSAEKISRERDGEDLQKRRKEFASEEWLFDRTPDFVLCLDDATSGRNAKIRLHVKKGHVVEQEVDGAVLPNWIGERLPLLGQLSPLPTA